MADYSTNLEEAVEKAREQGAEVVLPPDSPPTLLLDLDTPAQRDQWAAMRPMLHARFTIIGEQHWLSKSGNLHVMVALGTSQPLTESALVGLATACGSDPTRALLCHWQMAHDIEAPVMLFRPIGAEIKEVVPWPVPVSSPMPLDYDDFYDYFPF